MDELFRLIKGMCLDLGLLQVFSRLGSRFVIISMMVESRIEFYCSFRVFWIGLLIISN